MPFRPCVHRGGWQKRRALIKRLDRDGGGGGPSSHNGHPPHLSDSLRVQVQPCWTAINVSLKAAGS